MMKLRYFLMPMLFVMLTAQFCIAEGVVQEIRFPRGSNGTTISGSVIRGEADLYYLTAKAGQKMKITISSVEKNAVFQLYEPGNSVGKDEDGIMEVNGKTLPGAEEAMRWEGALPATGKYLILVGGTRGNATYKIKIDIAP
ncbi:MAG: hypothetical protein AAGU11_08905 [Syntrophobacteraceae bacterium]